MRTFAVLAGLGAALFAPTHAAADTRYADPAGSGVACTQGSPCTLAEAIANASDADEVIVNSGTYVESTGIEATGESLNIHGPAGEPRPVINSQAGPGISLLALRGGTVVNHLALNQTVADGTLISSALMTAGLILNDLDVTLEQTSTGLFLMGGSTATNVTINAPSGGVGITAAGNSTVQVRNATVIMGGGSTGVSASGNGTTTTVSVLSSIVRTGASGADFSAEDTGNPGDESIINVGNTNSTGQTATAGTGVINDQGGNETSAPVFIDGAGGDFRMQPSSPTIDAGTIDSFSTATDADGKPRPIGPAADMGAYEYGSAPTITTGAGTADSATTATVAGSINTNDSDSAYHFDYGPTIAYGSATGEGHLLHSLLGAQSITTSLAGLNPGTTYHYRLVSTNQLGTTVGADATFTTPANPVPPGNPTPLFTGAEIAKQKLKAAKRSRKFVLRVRCPVNAVDRCRGDVSITVKKRKRKLKLKAVKFNIARNTTSKVRFKLSKRQYRVLRKSKRMSGRASARTVDGAGQSRATSGKVTLKR